MARREAGWTTRGLDWERRASWYFLFFLTGVLYWAPLVYTGLRVAQPRWVLAGVFYGLPALAGFYFGFEWDPETWTARFTYAAYFVALLHAWGARGEYLARLDLQQAEQMETLLAAKEGGTEGMGAEIRTIIARHGAGRARGPRRVPDLNAMSEKEFALLPGFGPDLARRAVAVRRRVAHFTSFRHFAQEMPLDAEAYARLRPLFEDPAPEEIDPAVLAAMKEGMVHSVSGRVDFFTETPADRAQGPIDFVAEEAPKARRIDTGRSIEINAAAEEALAMLPGVGPELARKAVATRNADGPFRSMEDFGARVGIGEAMLKRIRELASVAPPPKDAPAKGGGGRVVDV